MSDFEVKVVKVNAVRKHPNADSLDIATVGGFNCITKLGEYKAGDLAVYIPEFAVLPEGLLKELSFWDVERQKGKLNGSKGDRVKIVRLRGVYSQGILLRRENMLEGQDVAEQLGIIKYEPPVPVVMVGQVANAGIGIFPKFDIENIQKHDQILTEGELVEFTEKLHGTCLKILFVRDTSKLPEDAIFEGSFIMSSKGQSDKGLVFKNNDLNKDNLYVRTVRNEGLSEKFEAYAAYEGVSERICFLGEVFGEGVQDLGYGQKKPSFRLFDIALFRNNEWTFLSPEERGRVCNMDEIPQVPVLYEGTYSKEIEEQYVNGKDTLGGNHVREGIVIKPLKPRTHEDIGRVVLKSVSQKYLMRKNGTEFN